MLSKTKIIFSEFNTLVT